MGLVTIFLYSIPFLIVSITLYLIYIYRKHSAYFRRRGLPYGGIGVVRALNFITGRMSLVDAELDIYHYSISSSNATKSDLVGFTDAFSNTAYVVTSLDLARNIYVRDFEHFVNRRQFPNSGRGVFSKMLVGMSDSRWRLMRSKLSPAFTTARIRRMFGIFERSGRRMCEYLQDPESPEGECERDLIEAFSKYSMDVIASCAFGVDSGSLDTKKPGELSRFEEMGQRMQLKFGVKTLFRILLPLVLPKLASALGITEPFDPEPLAYFSKAVKDVMKYRRENGERRDDFLQLMMDTREGLLKDEENSKETLQVLTGTDNEMDEASGGEGGEVKGEKEKLQFDDDAIIANCLLFILAGFDTLQSLLIFAAYALAKDQDVQERLLEEVKRKEVGHGGKLTYAGLIEMEYLDMFINETLRLYPPAPRNERTCTKDYPVPGTDIVIEKGSLVSLPVLGVHHDPEYYDLPEKFDPERFLPQNKSNRHPYAFAPFGHGMRNCIGMRFAVIEAKTVIATLVSNYKLEPCSRTPIPMVFGNSNALRPKCGTLWLKLSKR